MKSFLIIFSVSVFFIVPSYSQTLYKEKLDSLFTILYSRGLATGSVAISIEGKIVYQKAIGFVALDSHKKISPDIKTKYRIGSVTKMFTATVIFQLIDEKKLSLNDKLSRYFPQLPNADRITIGDMLRHRSGLHDYTKGTDFPAWMDKPKTHQAMVELIAAKGPDFEPGLKADYCNTNYLLLSYIIEKVDKTGYGEAIEKRITTRIGLKNTYYGKRMGDRQNEAASYKYSDSAWRKEKETDLSIHSGAGSLISTPRDLTIFIRNLFDGKLISQTSLDSMKAMVDGYGMGLFPYDFNTTKGYGHNGRIEEFYSAVRYYPEKRLALTYITNGILYPRTDILDGIVKICFNENYTIPFTKSAELPNSNLDRYVGTYSSGDLPFKVFCKIKNDRLIFDAAGKTMEAEQINPNYFMNLKAGLFFEFNADKGELKVKETDNTYFLQREK